MLLLQIFKNHLDEISPFIRRGKINFFETIQIVQEDLQQQEHALIRAARFQLSSHAPCDKGHGRLHGIRLEDRVLLGHLDQCFGLLIGKQQQFQRQVVPFDKVLVR